MWLIINSPTNQYSTTMDKIAKWICIICGTVCMIAFAYWFVYPVFFISYEVNPNTPIINEYEPDLIDIAFFFVGNLHYYLAYSFHTWIEWCFPEDAKEYNKEMGYL